MYGTGATVTISLAEASGVSRDQSASTINNATWYQIFVWYDATANIRSYQINTVGAQGSPVSASYTLGIWRQSNALVFGALQTNAQYFNGFIKRARLWKRALTAAERTLLWNSGSGQPYSALASLSPASTSKPGTGDNPSAPSAGTPGKVTYDGDLANVWYWQHRGNDYPSQTQALLGSSYTKLANLGVVGQQSTAAYSRVGATIDPPYDATVRSIIALWIGSNDIANATALATLQSNIALYGQWRRNVGFKVVLLTILSRNEFALDATKEANHRAFNTWLLANAVSSGYADAVVNLSSDVRLDDGTASLPAAVDSGDHIHLNNTGYGYVATLVKNAIVALG